jgi:hypothetical protein
MLLPRSARCVRTARVLYSQILDQIERKGYDVFSGRARVPAWRKAVTAARIMVTGPRSLKRQAEAYQRGASPMSLRTRISRLPQPFRPTRVRSNAFSNHEKVRPPHQRLPPTRRGPRGRVFALAPTAPPHGSPSVHACSSNDGIAEEAGASWCLCTEPVGCALSLRRAQPQRRTTCRTEADPEQGCRPSARLN